MDAEDLGMDRAHAWNPASRSRAPCRRGNDLPQRKTARTVSNWYRHAVTSSRAPNSPSLVLIGFWAGSARWKHPNDRHIRAAYGAPLANKAATNLPN